MQTRAVATFLAAILLAACASAPLDELPQSDDNLVGLVEEALSRDLELIGTSFVAQGVKGVRSVINNIQLK